MNALTDAPGSAPQLPTSQRPRTIFTGPGLKEDRIEVEARLSRPLTQEDLMLREVGGGGPQTLSRLKDSHHRLAQLLAQGYSNIQASAISGYAPSTISYLKTDPAFKELLEHYRTTTAEAALTVQDRLQSVAMDALQELQDRLVNSPEELSPGQVLNIVTSALDRSGHGPTSKIEKRVLNLNGNDLEKIKTEAQKRQAGTILLTPDRRPSNNLADGSGTSLPEAAAQGSQSEGDHLRE